MHVQLRRIALVFLFLLAFTAVSFSQLTVYLPVYTPHQLGLLANGSDEGAAFQTVLDKFQTSTVGGVIQLQAGDNLNLGTTQIFWPAVPVNVVGTGPEQSGQWGTFDAASSSITVGCAVDQYGCIIMGDIGNANFSNVAFRNTSSCATFFLPVPDGGALG